MKAAISSRGMEFSAIALLALTLATAAFAEEISFPQGTATPSETCGECHHTIYLEYMLGVGSDIHTSRPSPHRPGGIPVPAQVSSSATGHASSAYPTRDIKSDKIDYCNNCHFPDSFAISGKDRPSQGKAKKTSAATGGLTCASCHLTPEGIIRGPHATKGPHRTVAEPALQSSDMCGQCHGKAATGKRVLGKQFQTFQEWQEDYLRAGLGSQQCQDCHMPRTVRKSAEEFDVPPRAVARHLWTGANSRQRHLSSLGLSLVQPDAGKARFDLHVSNIGAGHSVPTGEASRGVFLQVEILDPKGENKVRKEWLFAPSHGSRPDDKAFLEQDKAASDTAAAQADAQGPHESSIRAGEERVLSCEPPLAPGEYAVKARLFYTVDRFAAKRLDDDRQELGSATMKLVVR